MKPKIINLTGREVVLHLDTGVRLILFPMGRAPTVHVEWTRSDAWNEGEVCCFTPQFVISPDLPPERDDIVYIVPHDVWLHSARLDRADLRVVIDGVSCAQGLGVYEEEVATNER